MQVREENGILTLYKEKTPIGRCVYETLADGAALRELEIVPEWRRRGYGSYLLREWLKRTGGYARNAAVRHTAPLPMNSEELAFWEKFDFRAENGLLVRRRAPELTAVDFVQRILPLYVPAPRLAIDATCGNGGDTLFLARWLGPQGRVLALDIQPAACESTKKRLQQAGAPQNTEVLCRSHAELGGLVAPGTADIIMFNFGWLPGAEHEVYTGAESSIPALQAALQALRPGGMLSAILYSGKVIGRTEKDALREWLRNLPITEYTVIECAFANWADTAPLPCLVWKKPVQQG